MAASCGEVTLGHEQFLRLTIELPVSDDSSAVTGAAEDPFTHIIVVADRSGSMSGNPWKQVRTEMKLLFDGLPQNVDSGGKKH